MTALCITADDYGLAPAINEAIEELAAAGAVQAVSVMAHGGAHLDTLPRLLDTGVAVGVHLVLTDEPGGYRALFRKMLFDPRLARRLAQRCAGQIERLRELGVPIAFVNSHEHVHMFPLLWPQLAPLVEGSGAGAVRFALDAPLSLSAEGALGAAARLSWKLRPVRGARVLAPRGAGRAGKLSLASIASMIADRDTDVLPELVFHPAADGRCYGGAGEDRRREYELLGSGAVHELLARHAVTVQAPV